MGVWKTEMHIVIHGRKSAWICDPKNDYADSFSVEPCVTSVRTRVPSQTVL